MLTAVWNRTERNLMCPKWWHLRICPFRHMLCISESQLVYTSPESCREENDVSTQSCRIGYLPPALFCIPRHYCRPNCGPWQSKVLSKHNGRNERKKKNRRTENKNSPKLFQKSNRSRTKTNEKNWCRLERDRKRDNVLRIIRRKKNFLTYTKSTIKIRWLKNKKQRTKYNDSLKLVFRKLKVLSLSFFLLQDSG